MKIKKFKSRRLTVLEANIDDMNPEWYEPLMERLFQAGALDVTLTPVVMKKGRPAIVLSVLSLPRKRNQLLNILFEESTTLGVRSHSVERFELDRSVVTVKTPYGTVSLKLGRDGSGEIRNVAPEFESCHKIAKEKKLPLQEVYRAALAAFKS